jgi:riboflavin transporter FmnP
MSEPSRQDKAILAAVFAKMDPVAMAVAIGVIFSLGLFLATTILLLQTVPEGYPVGPHLIALADYLPGYAVTWGGSVFGLVYGFLIGAVIGYVVAVVWNFAHYLSLGAMLLKVAMMAD